MLFNWLVSHRLLVYLLFTSFILAAIPGLGRIQITPDNRVFYGPENTQFNEVLAFESAYTSNNNIILVINFGEKFHNQKHVEAVRWLTEEVWSLDNVIRVDSIATHPHVRGIDDDIFVENTLDYFCPPPDSCHEDLARYLRDTNLENRLISSDLQSAGVIATLNLDLGAIGVVENISSQADELVRNFKQKFPNTEIVMTGGIPMMTAFATSSAEDLGLLLPVALVAIGCMLFLFFGGLKPTIYLVSISLISALCTFGIAGWLGHVVNAATSIAPLVIFTIVTASSMHLVLHYLRNSEAHSSKELISADVKAALEGNLTPMLASAITSIAGLMSLSFVDSPPLQQLGQLSALGTAIGVVLTITVLPLLLTGTAKGYRSKVRARVQQWLNYYARVIEQQRTFAISAFAALSVLLFGYANIEINDDFVDYFDQGTHFRTQTDRATELLSGPNHIEVLLGHEVDSGVFAPEYVLYLKSLTEFLRSQEHVSSVSSFLDILEELSGAFGINLQSVEDADQFAQWYLVYELSLQRGQSNTDFVRSDHQETRVSVLLSRTTSNQIKALESQIYDWHEAQGSQFKLRVTGENIPVAHLSAINISSMVGGFGLSILLITAIVGILARRIQLALAALAGTLAPLAIGFGAWGILGFDIGLATTAIIAVTIGVVIDDAVHMIYRFLDGRNRLRLDQWHAAAYAVHRAGMAVATTSIVMVAGLSVLLLSSFKVNSSFGAVTCLIITIALIFDLFVLPRLLVWSDPAPRSSER